MPQFLKSFSSFKVTGIQIRRVMGWIKRKTAATRLRSINHWYVVDCMLLRIFSIPYDFSIYAVILYLS